MEVDIELDLSKSIDFYWSKGETLEHKIIKLPIYFNVNDYSNDSYALLETEIINTLKNAMLKNTSKKFIVTLTANIQTYVKKEKRIKKTIYVNTNNKTNIQQFAYDIKRICNCLFSDIIYNSNLTFEEIINYYNVITPKYKYIPHAKNNIYYLKR